MDLAALPDFSLLVVEGCPHEDLAAEIYQEALALLGVGRPIIQRVVVDDDATARRLRFSGSPSFHVDGHDVFPLDGEPSLTCRLYRSLTGGPAGVPTALDLIRSLRGMLDSSSPQRAVAQDHPLPGADSHDRRPPPGHHR